MDVYAFMYENECLRLHLHLNINVLCLHMHCEHECLRLHCEHARYGKFVNQGNINDLGNLRTIVRKCE
jgi:hypothetical protein